MSGYGPIPEKFLMIGVDAYCLLSSLPLMMSHTGLRSFIEAGQERGHLYQTI